MKEGKNKQTVTDMTNQEFKRFKHVFLPIKFVNIEETLPKPSEDKSLKCCSQMLHSSTGHRGNDATNKFKYKELSRLGD